MVKWMDKVEKNRRKGLSMKEGLKMIRNMDLEW